MSTKEAVQRTRINFVLGLDRITVSGADNIRKLEESGDTDRVIDADRNLQSLPLWARIFFPVTRFYSTVYGWFLPFVVSSHSSYKPCRAFLDQRFSKRAFFTDDVKAAADELEKGAGADTDTLNGTYQRAIFRSFGGSTDLPQELLDETKNQAKGIADAVLPWKRWPAQSCAKAVYSYAAKTRDQLPDAKGLPDEVVTNMGHSLTATQLNGATILRAIAADQDTPAATVIGRTTPTKVILRVVTRTGNLGGLLKDSEPAAVAGKSVVVLNLGSAAELADPLWAFGTGTEHRQCAAKPAIIDFASEVQKELKRRRGA